jgi:3-deoxy-manno-octulosonate cytidylyltransferase (CMP-KDO synthetase)
MPPRIRYTIVIPARLGSTRLPGKVLAEIAGKPLIGHVYARAKESRAESVVIATDNERVAAVCTQLGADVQLTSPMHHSGTDRVQEVAAARKWPDDRLIVNLQGDEPLMPPAVLDACARVLAADTEADIGTCAHALHAAEDFANPNIVKLVRDVRGRALYFSRARIPCLRGADEAAVPDLALRHIGVYAYRVEALRRFAALPPGPLENCESLEQLRALEHGMRIAVAVVDKAPARGIDTPEDLEYVRGLMAGA